MDDRRVGLVIRALRRRRGWRQSDLAAAAGFSQATISGLERGHVDNLSLRTLRRILLALEARADVDLRWRGGALDRVVDEGHARVVGRVVRWLASHGWRTSVEVTYSVYG
ncbi:MAG: helix-turn-helix domain-containing protein, partial [Candidatus Limnocylindrales bacterium]